MASTDAEGLTVRWCPSAQNAGLGIVAVTIPKQRADVWPIAVVKTVEDPAGKASGTLLGYYERRGEHVPAIPATDHSG